MPTHLHLDPFSGIAGDMFLGAAIDLGADPVAIRAALAPLAVHSRFELAVTRVQKHGIGAVDLKVLLTAAPAGDHAHVLMPGRQHHEHVRYADMIAMADQIDAPPRARQRARKVIDALARAEARVHEMPVENVHFHEVGAIDSIVDMLGSMVALELLGVDTLSCGPLPISRGFIRCDHGVMPVPAPAAAYLMEGMPTFGVDRTGELVTPTGAAIVAGVCESFGVAPPMILRKVGYGAGDRDDPNVPNLLRMMMGDRR